MLPPGGYDWKNAAPRDVLLQSCCYLQDAIIWERFDVTMPPSSFGLNSYCDPFRTY